MIDRTDIEILYERSNDMLFVVAGQPGYFRWSWTGGVTAPWLQRGSRYEYGEILLRAGRREAINELIEGLNSGRFVGMDDDTLQFRAWNLMIDNFDRKIHLLRGQVNGHARGTAAHTVASRNLSMAETGRRNTLRKVHGRALELAAERTAVEGTLIREGLPS